MVVVVEDIYGCRECEKTVVRIIFQPLLLLLQIVSKILALSIQKKSKILTKTCSLITKFK